MPEKKSERGREKERDRESVTVRAEGPNQPAATLEPQELGLREERDPREVEKGETRYNEEEDVRAERLSQWSRGVHEEKGRNSDEGERAGRTHPARLVAEKERERQSCWWFGDRVKRRAGRAERSKSQYSTFSDLPWSRFRTTTTGAHVRISP